MLFDKLRTIVRGKSRAILIPFYRYGRPNYLAIIDFYPLFQIYIATPFQYQKKTWTV